MDSRITGLTEFIIKPSLIQMEKLLIKSLEISDVTNSHVGSNIKVASGNYLEAAFKFFEV